MVWFTYLRKNYFCCTNRAITKNVKENFRWLCTCKWQKMKWLHTQQKYLLIFFQNWLKRIDALSTNHFLMANWIFLWRDYTISSLVKQVQKILLGNSIFFVPITTRFFSDSFRKMSWKLWSLNPSCKWQEYCVAEPGPGENPDIYMKRLATIHMYVLMILQEH